MTSVKRRRGPPAPAAAARGGRRRAELDLAPSPDQPPLHAQRAGAEVDVVETPFSTGTSTHLLHGGTLTAPTTDAQAGGDAVHDVPLSDDFHVFAVTRTADAVTWTIDDEEVQLVDRASAPDGLRWVFTQPFHVLFSLAVGGR